MVHSISSSAPGPQTDAAFIRQQEVNSYLGRRVFCAYSATLDVQAKKLVEELAEIGFEVPWVELESQERLRGEILKIESKDLWISRTVSDNSGQGLLIATPFGFGSFSSVDEFRAMLPQVHEIEIGNQ